MTVIPIYASGYEIQHFNPDVLGRPSSDCVLLLSPTGRNAIKPISILTDINEKGHFYAATITYPESVTFEIARDSLNSMYRKYEVKSFVDDMIMGLWRNEDKDFAIQLSKMDQGGRQVVQIIYISFLTNKVTPDISLDPVLTSEQLVLIADLSDTQREEIDLALLLSAGKQYRKVARVVAMAMYNLRHRVKGIPDIYYSQRIMGLVEEGLLISRGNLKRMRYSAVKLP